MKSRYISKSMIVLTLTVSCTLLLILGVFSFGLREYAGASTANAARVAALYTSSDSSRTADESTACALVKEELKYMLNAFAFSSNCRGSGPLRVRLSTQTGPDGSPSSRVRVTYELIPLFIIPGLGGERIVTRSAEMRVLVL